MTDLEAALQKWLDEDINRSTDAQIAAFLAGYKAASERI